MRRGQISSRGREGSQGHLCMHCEKMGLGGAATLRDKSCPLQLQDLAQNPFKNSSQCPPEHCSL